LCDEIQGSLNLVARCDTHARCLYADKWGIVNVNCSSPQCTGVLTWNKPCGCTCACSVLERKHILTRDCTGGACIDDEAGENSGGHW
jgi:hypothetical protein